MSLDENWKFYLALMFVCLLVQGFFAMLEMACVSFNKVRLQYYVSKNNRRAIWLSKLLNHPGRLFGTSLICVNTALQVGSECSRRFYDSLGFNPSLAPLSQVVIVLILAEIAPLFAGRRFAEHVAMMGIPVLYTTSIILKPAVWFFDGVCRLVHYLVGSSEGPMQHLSREELQKILEEQEEEEFNTVVKNIFSLKFKTAQELMQPLSQVQVLPSTATVAQMRTLLKTSYTPYVPIYLKNPENIVAIAYPRDLLRCSGSVKVREESRPPWFITTDASVLSILEQFRGNNQSLAIVLDGKGLAVGILTLDEVVDEIFERSETSLQAPTSVVLDRTLRGDMKISDFNNSYRVCLKAGGSETLEELMEDILGHSLQVGDVVKIDNFELKVEESSLLGIKHISVRTLY